MYMVGGSGGRVQRGGRPYAGARRWMEPPKPRRPLDWGLVVDVIMAFATFGALIWTLALIALYCG